MKIKCKLVKGIKVFNGSAGLKPKIFCTLKVRHLKFNVGYTSQIETAEKWFISRIYGMRICHGAWYFFTRHVLKNKKEILILVIWTVQIQEIILSNESGGKYHRRNLLVRLHLQINLHFFFSNLIYIFSCLCWSVNVDKKKFLLCQLSSD